MEFLRNNFEPHPVFEQADFSPENVGLKALATEISDDDVEASRDLRRRVATFWDDAVADFGSPPAMIKRLASVPSRLIVTFNYDQLIELAAPSARRLSGGKAIEVQ